MSELNDIQLQLESLVNETVALEKFYWESKQALDPKYRAAAESVYTKRKADILARTEVLQSRLRALISQIRKDVGDR